MTIKELHINLRELQIPENRYYLNGLFGSSDDNDKIALTIRKGKYTVEYETYFKERGEKHSIRTITNEDEVSNWLLKDCWRRRILEITKTKIIDTGMRIGAIRINLSRGQAVVTLIPCLHQAAGVIR